MSFWVSGATLAVGAYSATQQKKSAQKATEAQQKGISEAQQLQTEAAQKASGMLNPLANLRTPAQANLQKIGTEYMGYGREGIADLQGQQGALNVKQFLDPSMNFAMKEGTKAIEASAAARGGLLSGANLKALTQYGQGLASQNYNTAVSQAMANRAQQVGIASNMANLGSTGIGVQEKLFDVGAGALGNQANIVAGQGSNNANLAMTSGNVAAAGQMAQPSVVGSAITAGLGVYQGQQYLDRKYPQPTPTAQPTSPTPSYAQPAAPVDYSLGSTAQFGLSSDEDLKEDKSPITDEEIDEFLSRIDPQTYSYKEDAQESKGLPEGRQAGVMAQDVEKSEIGEELVSDDEDGDKVIDIPKSVGALLATSASLNRRIKKLEGKK